MSDSSVSADAAATGCSPDCTQSRSTRRLSLRVPSVRGSSPDVHTDAARIRWWSCSRPLAARTIASGSIPGSSTSTACTCSSVPCETPTTPDSRTPGSSFSTRSTSSGNTFSPSGVTIISFLRPLMNSRPCASRSPMSPVWSQPSVVKGLVAAGNRDSGFGIRLGFGIWALGFGIFVIPARHVFPSHQDLAVVGDAHLDAFDRRADRSLARLERMIQRDDRRRLGQAVSLDDGEPHAPPELLEVRRQRRGAHDKRPELHPERGVDAAIAPPASGIDMPAGGASADSGHARTACSRSTSSIFGTQTSTETRRALISFRMSCGLKLRVKMTVPRHHRRDVGGHRLAEHVAERQQVQEPQRVERPRVFAVLQNLALDRDDVREDVAVADDHAFRLRGRARREDDLGDVVARDGDRRHRAIGAPVEIGKRPPRGIRRSRRPASAGRRRR